MLVALAPEVVVGVVGGVMLGT